jgi:thiosulfate dehydrogenase
MNHSIGHLVCAIALGGVIGGCNKSPPPATTDAVPAATAPVAAAPARFTPPAESEIPANELGEAILLGKNIFVNTQQYATEFVGNGLNCANCHLGDGRKADSAPLWAAYGLYPAFRDKTGQIETIQSRIQGCFLYSMNGRAPACIASIPLRVLSRRTCLMGSVAR